MAAKDFSALLNETVNQTVDVVNVTSTGIDVLSYLGDDLLPRVYDLLMAPFEHPEMLWTLGPMIIALVLMQLYFGRNKDESLGWNTAFGNSIALIFISVSLLRGLFIISGKATISEFISSVFVFDEIKILVIVFLFLYGILLSMMSFFHWVPEKLAFFIMNGLSINVTAYVGIVLVNSDDIPLDWTTILAGIVIFVFVYAVAMVVRYFIPASEESRMHLLERKKYMLESNVKRFRKKAKTAKSEQKRERFEYLADKYHDKAHDVSSDMKVLMR